MQGRIDANKSFTAGAPVSPDLFLFEWRHHVQHKLRAIEDELSILRRNTVPADGQDISGPQETPAQRNLRLLKEIEDEEQKFQRKTIKLAMETARSEGEKVMTKAISVEASLRRLQEQMEAMQQSFAQERERSQQREKTLQDELAEVVSENKRLSHAVEDITRQLKDGEKHRKDLEEAIFYLQDEIIKNKPKPLPPPPEPQKKKK